MTKKRKNVGKLTGMTRRFSYLLLCLFLFSNFSAMSAIQQQDGKIKINEKQISLSELFWKIQSQTQYEFLFDDKDLQQFQNLDISEEGTVQEVLNAILKGKGLTFEKKGKVFIVKKQAPQAKQQEKIILKGKITDKEGQPIPGATVMIEGSHNGTATNVSGIFLLNSPKSEGVLLISFVGFKAQKVTFSGDDLLSVMLEEDVSGLDEVKIIAYGKTNRRESTGAVSVVTADDIKGIPSPSIAGLLQGRVAGMDVTNVSGAPGGGGAQITIRGYNSLGIEAGRRFSNPLWVIDGVPMSSFNSPVTGTNGLSDLNPEMIESIHVLKDASSTSLYGSRAANGVIIVTTKKGKQNQKGQFSVNFSRTYSVLPEFPVLYGGKGERDYRLNSKKSFRKAFNDRDNKIYRYPTSYNDAWGTYGSYDNNWGNGSTNGPTNGSIYQDSLNTFYNNSTNFYKNLYRIGKVTNANIQTHGGSEAMTYSIGLGYYDEQGILKGSGYNRLNLMGNFRVKPVKNLSVDFNNYLSMADRSRGVKKGGMSSGEDVEFIPGSALSLSSILPYQTKATEEALNKFHQQQEKNVTYRLRSSFRVQYDFTDDFSFTNTLSLDYSQNNRNSFSPAAMDQYKETLSVGEIGRNSTFLNESLLKYKHEFNNGHSFDVMTGLSFQADENNYIGGSGKGGPGDYVHYVGEKGWPDLIERDNGQQQVMKQFKTDFTEKKLNSYFGRLNYDYKKKYFFTATVRRDGSSVFGANLKWATFPSVAAAWNISEESFLQGAEFLDFAKIKTSYGTSGNIFKNPYLAYGILEGGGIYRGKSSVKPDWQEGFYNPNLSWEESKQLDIGVDVSLFNYKLNVTADFYHKKSEDMLYKVGIPGNYSTYASQWKNAASILNKGFELEIKYDVFRNENGYWRASLNLAKNWNRLDESWNNKDFVDSKNQYYFILGKKLNGIYGLKTDGYLQTEDDITRYYGYGNTLNGVTPDWQSEQYRPGDTKFVDVNGDYKINWEDNVYLGSSLPDITGGILNEVRWKNFDLNVLMSFSMGRDMINAVGINSLGKTTETAPLLLDIDNTTFWEKAGDNTDYPMATLSNYNRNFNPVQDQYIESVNYLKIKTLTLGYTLPKSELMNKYFREVRVFFSGENLLTFTNYSGIDPEIVDMRSGIDEGKSYPLARKLTLGITIKL